MALRSLSKWLHCALTLFDYLLMLVFPQKKYGQYPSWPSTVWWKAITCLLNQLQLHRPMILLSATVVEIDHNISSHRLSSDTECDLLAHSKCPRTRLLGRYTFRHWIHIVINLFKLFIDYFGKRMWWLMTLSFLKKLLW